MKAAFFALSVATFAATPARAEDGEQLFKADPQQSTVQWHGSKVVGGGHTGEVSVKTAQVLFAGDAVKSADVEIDMTTIVDEDLKDASFNKKLVDHLRSSDFFDVEKRPTATLAVTSATPTKAGSAEYDVKGTLTIKGTSKPVAFKATERRDGDRRIVKAALAFDRTEFDVRYGSGKFFANLGDKVIADEIKLDVELALVPADKQSAQN
jgi:polyisoprenoid-binding protein YceI